MEQGARGNQNQREPILEKEGTRGNQEPKAEGTRTRNQNQKEPGIRGNQNQWQQGTRGNQKPGTKTKTRGNQESKPKTTKGNQNKIYHIGLIHNFKLSLTKKHNCDPLGVNMSPTIGSYLFISL